ncbi:peptide/nickel transport system substrate-binding protein [Bosea sp. BK604]|nr:ABC transporter substrate-binding protein [Bosea sp. BK604]TCR66582.1 peptide/nickel transport system substrate-binding protein [Bosea sp. BK604]
MDRRTFLGASLGLAAGSLASPHVARAAADRVIKFIPQRDLNSKDPMWIPAANVRTHGYMIFDTLYGIDENFRPQPQMAEGAAIEDDGKLWKIRLRPGLKFHDGTPVLARDAAASIRRFCVRDPLGQALAAVTDELSAPDDRTIQFRLKRPFALLPDALSSTPLFMPAIMPERLANTDPMKQVTDMVGSGPFRYVANEEMQGERYAYEKFAGYVPRDSGTPGWTAGPKVVNIDRVEWKVIPDPATIAAALQTGEADWIEYAPLDLLDVLRSARNVKVAVTDPTGMKADMRMNQAIPPFDNPEIRRALLGAVKQEDYCIAMAGTDPSGWKARVGFFVPGSPMASDAGLDVFDTPRDFAAVAAKIKAAGYKNEKVVIMSPGDIPAGKAASIVNADMLQKVGMNVDYAELDWASIAQRRMKKEPVEQGGWNIWIAPGPGLSQFNPVAATLLRTGPQAYFGWPKSDRLEELRNEWLTAPDLAAQKRVAVEIQKQAFIDLPMIPLGMYYQPTAYRTSLEGVLSGFATFWNVRKA